MTEGERERDKDIMLTALYLFDRGENVKNRMLVAFSLFDIGERHREIRTEC